VPITGLTILTITIGLAAEPIFVLSTQAADQLLHPTDYVQTVLGG
jgi:multicomponent Na+:H+ antiporter subunit D